MQQLLSHLYFFHVPAASFGPLTYSIEATFLQYRSYAHTTGLLSTAVLLLQHNIIDLLTAVEHTLVGASAVDVTVPQPKPSCP